MRLNWKNAVCIWNITEHVPLPLQCTPQLFPEENREEGAHFQRTSCSERDMALKTGAFQLQLLLSVPQTDNYSLPCGWRVQGKGRRKMPFSKLRKEGLYYDDFDYYCYLLSWAKIG
jgi:hypothetical protein